MIYRLATYQHPLHAEKAVAILTEGIEPENITSPDIGWQLIDVRSVELPPVSEMLTNRLLLSREAMDHIDLQTLRFWLGPLKSPDADDIDEVAAERMQTLLEMRDQRFEELTADFDRPEPD